MTRCKHATGASDIVYSDPRRVGRTHRRRVMAAWLKLHDAQLKHADTLTDSDAERFDRELAAWVEVCESAGADALAVGIRVVGGAIAWAGLNADTNLPAARYIDLRTPFLEYAEEAMRRRFPEPHSVRAGGVA